MRGVEMKVRITITVTVDEKEWARAYGLDERDVREDVKQYIGNGIWSSYPAESGLITDVEWR
jgi:hypothetical protein